MTPFLESARVAKGMHYASEMTDGERARIEPFMPPVKVLGGPRTTDLREVVDGLLYLLRAGGPWRLLPKDLEATIASAEAWLFLASIQPLMRRLARA